MSLDDVVKIQDCLETLASAEVAQEQSSVPTGTPVDVPLTEADVFKDNVDDADLMRLMTEMAAAGDPTGGVMAGDSAPRQKPRRSPFHGVTLVYSRKCPWQAMLAAVVGRKVATVEVNSPGDYPEGDAALRLITGAPSTVVIGARECAKRLGELPGVAQVVSCVETPLSISDLLGGGNVAEDDEAPEEVISDKIIEESFDGLYAWLGLSPTDVYICDYMRIAAGIGKPSIYGEITAADARCLVVGLKMSGLLWDDGTGSGVPRWAVGDVRTMTYGARGFDNINNYVVVGQTLETHRTREFEEFVKTAPTQTCGDARCMLINCRASETSRVLAAALPVHAVLFFTLCGDLWHCELYTGSVQYQSKDELGNTINVIHYLASGLEMDGSKLRSVEEHSAVFDLNNEELVRLLSMK